MSILKSKRHVLNTVAALAAATILATGIGAQSKKDYWVSTWATAPVARAATPAAAPAGAGAPVAAAPPVASAPAAPAAAAAPPAGARGQAAPGAAPGAGRGGAAANPVIVPNNQTLRQIVHISLGGDRLRVVVANSFGTRALPVGGASVALRTQNSAIDVASLRPLTFSGERAISIPPGATMVSDPVALTVPNFADLAIDLFISGDTAGSVLTRHSVANQTNYVAAGNVVGAADLTEPTTIRSWYFLSRVEMSAPEKTPVVVATGDSITDGTLSTVDTNGRWPDVLARRLLAQRGRKIAVVNAGISANRVLSDAAGDGGVNILSRLDRDVLVQSGATHMVFMLGINDIGQARANPSPSAADLIAGHRQVIERARAQGLRVYGATLTPYEGAAYYTPEGEVKRKAVNEWIRTGKEYDGVVDFDAATRDPKLPTKFVPDIHAGDWLHPNNKGYEIMGNAVKIDLFK